MWLGNVKYNSDISPDYGWVDLAGGLKMVWQRYVVNSCVSSGYGSNCAYRFDFKEPFKEGIYYVTAIGQDSADGSAFQAAAEGSEMNFAVISQDPKGATIKATRVTGSNDSGREVLGVTVYSIGK